MPPPTRIVKSAGLRIGRVEVIARPRSMRLLRRVMIVGAVGGAGSVFCAMSRRRSAREREPRLPPHPGPLPTGEREKCGDDAGLICCAMRWKKRAGFGNRGCPLTPALSHGGEGEERRMLRSVS